MKRYIIVLTILMMFMLTGCGNSSQDKLVDNHPYMEYQETTLYEKKIKDSDIVNFWVDSKGVPYVMLCKITYGKDNYNEIYTSASTYNDDEDTSGIFTEETMGDRNYNYVIYKLKDGELEWDNTWNYALTKLMHELGNEKMLRASYGENGKLYILRQGEEANTYRDIYSLGIDGTYIQIHLYMGANLNDDTEKYNIIVDTYGNMKIIYFNSIEEYSSMGRYTETGGNVSFASGQAHSNWAVGTDYTYELSNKRVYEFDNREYGSYSRTIEYADLQSVYDVMAVDENDNLYIINDEGIARLNKDGDIWEKIYEDGMHLNSNFFVTKEMIVRDDNIYIYGYFKEDTKYAVYSYSLQEAKQ